jgi:hypothetical protein
MIALGRSSFSWILFDFGQDADENGKYGNEGWLFIARVFGKEDIFLELSRKLVKHICINEKGKYRGPGGKSLPEPMPPGCIGLSPRSLSAFPC